MFVNKMTSLYIGRTLAVALIVCVSYHANGHEHETELKALCANSKQLEITRSSQIRALAEQLSSSEQPECSSRLRVALVELDQLISSPAQGNGDICSLEEVEKIKEYYEKYISSTLTKEHTDSSSSGNGDTWILPKTLKNFVLGYGLKVSSLCKKNMINSLMLDGHTLLKEEDFESIAPWTDDSSAISQIMNEPSDYDDLLLPRDLNRLLREEGQGSDSMDSDKIFLQTATGQMIEQLQALCERRFKPIYEQLILPLIYLSNMGFNYQGEDLEREMKEMSVNKEIHQWYRIVYLCESMNGIEIVEPDELAGANRNELTEEDRKAVRILTGDEVKVLKAARAERCKGAACNEKEATKFAHIEQVFYAPEYGNRIEDQVLDLGDRNLMKLINSFATHKSELDRVRAKLMRKLATFLFERLKRGQFKLVHSFLGKRGSDKVPGGQDDNDQMVRVFDEYVSQVTSSGENSVSSEMRRGKHGGISGVAKRYYHQAAADGVGGLTQRAAKKVWDKASISRIFYYALAVCLFIAGLGFLLAG